MELFLKGFLTALGATFGVAVGALGLCFLGGLFSRWLSLIPTLRIRRKENDV